MNVRFLPGTAIVYAMFPLSLVCFVSQAKPDEDNPYSEDDALSERYGSSFPSGFESFGEKRVFHHRRIRGMKNNLNDYSSNLHDLRRRFRQIFYGRDEGGQGTVPFAIGEEIAPAAVPDRNRVEYVPPAPKSPRPDPHPMISLDPPEPELVREEDQLAFTVDGPGSYRGRSGESIPVVERRSDFDYYVFPRIGYSHPAKKHDTPGEYSKEYKVGYSIALSAGVRRGPWTFGLDLSHRHNELKNRSFFYSRSAKHYFQESACDSTGILLQGSYALPVYSKLSLLLRGGLGASRYRISGTFRKDGSITVQAIPHKVLWVPAFTAGGSLGWAFTENMTAHLGLHYYHEDEVPSYNADLGLEFDF